MFYYRLIISLFLVSFAQGVFATNFDFCDGNFSFDLDDEIFPPLDSEAEGGSPFGPMVRPILENPDLINSSPVVSEDLYQNALAALANATNHPVIKSPISIKNPCGDNVPAPAPVPIPFALAPLASTATTTANTSKLPLVVAFIKYKKKIARTLGKRMKLSAWFIDKSKFAQTEKALKALKDGDTCLSVSNEFGISRRTLRRWSDILKNIALPAVHAKRQSDENASDFAPQRKRKRKNLRVSRWEDKLALFKAYVEKHKNALVPAKFDTEAFPKLGKWVLRQRKSYRNGKLSEDLIAKLKAAGFAWSVHAAIWEGKFALLKAYVKKYGDALVPAKFDTEAFPKLGEWVVQLRRSYREEKARKRGKNIKGNHHISEDQMIRLNDLNFEWNPTRGRRKQTTS